MRPFNKTLLFIIFFTIFGCIQSQAEIKPGLPKLYLNDVEAISTLYISDQKLYLDADGLCEIGVKTYDQNDDLLKFVIGDTQLQLDPSSGIAAVYRLNSKNFLPVAYTVINNKTFNKANGYAVKDFAPYIGYRYSRIHNVDLYRLTDGTDTITEEALYEINVPPVVEANVPKTGPKSDEGKNHSPGKDKKKTGKKVVYLTFDDGPNKYTPEILDLLDKYDMKATFFMLNYSMKENPELVKQIEASGHGMGLHGVSHRKNIFYKDVKTPATEMSQANLTLENILGIQTKLVRTPYGSKPYLSDQQYQKLTDNGFLLWDWNVDSGDSSKAYVASKVIIDRVLTGLKAKSKPVVLLHDKECTADALETILIWMKKNGYESKSLTEEMTPLNWSK